jgi:hypothetical protein
MSGSASGASPFCAVIHRRLHTRGFRNLTVEQACSLEAWMRFNPAMNTLLFALATLAGSSLLMLLLAALFAVGMLTAVHPFEWFYAAVIRPLEQSPELPASPPRRRAVFALGMACSLAVAWNFHFGSRAAGIVLGSLMTASTALLALTHICVPSLAFRSLRAGFQRLRRRRRPRPVGQ